MPLFPKVVILYGTETGNSQDLSKIIAWTLSRLEPEAIKIQVMSGDDYPIKQLPEEKFVLIVCSTSGLGEAPLNMRMFWRFVMRKDLPSDSLSDLTFAVIGLGDSTYAKFNWVAKKLYKRFLSLGAKSLLDLCLGDERHEFGSFFTIDPWLRQFYAIMTPENVHKLSIDDQGLIQPSFRINLVSGDGQTGDEFKTNNSVVEHEAKLGYDQLHPFTATVLENKRVTSDDHFQDVRLIKLELNENIKYKVTDIVVVYPENHQEQVDCFLSLFDGQLDGEEMVHLELNEQYWIPQSSYYLHMLKYENPIRIRDLVHKYLDINSIPKRSFFDLFYRFSRDQLERDKLKRFASGADLDELYDYVNRPKRTILEVMADFPNTTPHVPLQYLLDLIPAMAWRSYSIASSPLVDPTSIQILYAVVNYRTRLKKPRLGQCTNWMVVQQPNMSSLSIFLRTSTFKLPTSGDIPLIMIAAGTGVAPFRAFIHDRTLQNIGNNFLFFGCRYRDKDYYLQDEWIPLVNRKLLTVFEAFSREDPDRKRYVQHVVLEQKDLINDLFFNRNGVILIAGKSKQYPELVREALIDVFKAHLTQQHDQDYFDDLFNKLETTKRIQFECW